MNKILLDIYRLIFARKSLFWFNRILFKLSLKGLGILNFENNQVSGEHYLVRKLLPALIKSDTPVFFDVGANVGNFSAALLETFPHAVIHCFEPHPENFRQLNDRKLSSRLHAHHMALGDSPGTLTLYDRADSDGSSHASLHEAVITDIHKQPALHFSVSVQTLDDFTDAHQVTFIDFLKIDTEGNEYAVLKGASRLINSGRIGCIHFEFNEMNIISRSFLRDFRKLLPAYDLYRLLPSGLLLLDDIPVFTEIFAYQNIIALPKGSR